MSTEDPGPTGTNDGDQQERPDQPTRTPAGDFPDGVRPAVEDDLDEPVAEAPPADAERRDRDPMASPLPPDEPDPLDQRTATD